MSDIKEHIFQARVASVRNKIDPANLTFVIQGPISFSGKRNLTKSCSESIRKFFPGAKIVLSTWEGEDLQEIEYDTLVISQDPGFTRFRAGDSSLNNTNRQIMSTVEGLKTVETEYAVKIRSDLVFQNGALVEILAELENRERKNAYCLTSQYVLIADRFTIHPRKELPLLNHPCDWFYAGRTEDLLDIWDIPLASTEDLIHFAEINLRSKYPLAMDYLPKYRPEAFIWTTFLNKKGIATIINSYENNVQLEEKCTLFLVNNLTPMSIRKIGMRSEKYGSPFHRHLQIMSYQDWLVLVGDDKNKSKSHLPMGSFPRLLHRLLLGLIGSQQSRKLVRNYRSFENKLRRWLREEI